MRLAMRRPKRTLGHRNTAELALETNREKMRGGGDGEKKRGREGGTERNKYLISSRGCSVRIYSKKKHEKKSEKKVGGSGEEGRGGRMDGRTNGWTQRRDLESKKANYPARLLGSTGRGSDASY